MNNFRKTGNIPNNTKNEFYKPIKTVLSERYKDVINRQVVGMLNSKLSNFKILFNKIVLSNDSLDDDTKMKLCFINKHQMYYYKGNYVSDKISVSEDMFKLARWIFKHFIGRLPNCNNINMMLQNKVAQLEESNNINSTKYPFVIRLSTHSLKIHSNL